MAVIVRLHPTPSFQPRGAIASIFPDGWRGSQYDYRFAKPYPVAAQPFPSFQPQGLIRSTFPDGWRGAQWDVKFTAPFAASQQQFPSAFQPKGTITSTTPQGGFQTTLDFRFKPPVAIPDIWSPQAALSTVMVVGSAGATFVSAGGGGLKIRLYPTNPTLPLGPPAVAPSNTTTSGWFGTQFDYRFKAPITAALHEFFSPLPQGPVPPTSAAGSFDGMVVSPRLVGDQSWYPLAALSIASNTTTKGWAGYQLDYKFSVPLSPTQQQWSAFQPRGTINSLTPQGGFQTVLDFRFKPPVAIDNTWYPLTALSTVILATPEGWRGYQYDLAFAKPYPIGDQPFTASPAPQVPRPPGNGWWGFQWEVRYAAPFAASQQQYSAFQPRGAIVSTTPQGWNGWQFDYKFAKANSPALPQEWFPLVKLLITPNTTAWRQQSLSPEVFGKSFPAALQQFDALGMLPEAQIEIVPLPPGGGGHRKRKPLQPIWDRQRELDRARAASAGDDPARPLTRREKRAAAVARSATETGQAPNLSGLADLLLPTVGGQQIKRPSTAAPVVTLPAGRVTATITEAGLDVARGLVSTTDIIRADGLITEAADQLHATASVNDDGQALKMLEAAHKADRQAAIEALREMLASEDDPEAIEEYRAVLAALEGKE